MTVTEVVALTGNKAIEDAAIDWVMELERRAGRSPVDRRYEAAFAGDIQSDPYTIEVKAVGGSVRGFGLPIERNQYDAAKANPHFVLDVVENVAQGDSRLFVHHRFEGDRLHRLIENAKPRTYYEVPLPVGDYDVAPVHSSLASGPVQTPDTRPDWVRAVGASRAATSTIGDIAQPIVTVRVELPRWVGPKLTWQETYGKTAIVGSDGNRTCAEVEVVTRLRANGWNGGWIDTYGQAPQAWRGSIVKPAELPEPVRGQFLRVDGAIEQSRMTGGGRWDILAWRGEEILVLELKGAGDKIRPKQIAWLATALDAGWPTSSFGVINYVVRP